MKLRYRASPEWPRETPPFYKCWLVQSLPIPPMSAIPGQYLAVQRLVATGHSADVTVGGHMSSGLHLQRAPGVRAQRQEGRHGAGQGHNVPGRHQQPGLPRLHDLPVIRDVTRYRRSTLASSNTVTPSRHGRTEPRRYPTGRTSIPSASSASATELRRHATPTRHPRSRRALPRASRWEAKYQSSVATNCARGRTRLAQPFTTGICLPGPASADTVQVAPGRPDGRATSPSQQIRRAPSLQPCVRGRVPDRVGTNKPRHHEEARPDHSQSRSRPPPRPRATRSYLKNGACLSQGLE